MTAPLTAEAIQAMFERSPFIRFLGLTVESLDHDRQEITLRMPMAPELERRPGTGQFHGGPVAALIDTAGDFAIALGAGGGVPTINFRTDFLRPATGSALLAFARVRRAGRTVGVVDIDVTDDAGRLCAIGRGTYSTHPG